MKANIKDLLHAVGDNKAYQVYILTIMSITCAISDIIALVLGLLEIKPNIITPNGLVPLTYDLCSTDYTLAPDQVGHSYVIIYGIYCNPYYVSLIGGISFFGVLISNLIIPSIVDRYGRLKCAFYSGLSTGVLFICYSFTPIEIGYLFSFLFLQGVLTTFMYISSYFLISESVNKNLRAKYQVLMINFFTGFGMIYALVFYYFQDIFLIKRCAGILLVISSLLMYFSVYESPRYYHSSGKEKEMDDVLIGIAKFNGTEAQLNEFREKTVHLIKKQDPEKKVKENKKIQEIRISDLFCDPTISKTFALMSIIWFASSGFYYGSVIFIKILPGNVYFSALLLSVAEFLSNFFTNFIIEVPCLGRKGAYFLLYSVDCLMFAIIYLFPLGPISSSLVLVIIRFFSNSLYNIGYIYSVEVYPTVLRATGVSYNSITGRIGIIINLFLIEILGNTYFLFCFGMGLICLVTVCFLKETLNHEMKDFIEEKSDDE